MILFLRRNFALLTLALLAASVLHTLWATSLDGFTIDEPYHIVAGATYLRGGDYRINPEHPPLVKLVAALAEPADVLRIGSFPKIEDKRQERIFTQSAVYKASDYASVHRRARIAMIAFNALGLLALTMVARRVFSPEIALVTLLLLALDPTVSAHMPVVMTDLPMALIGTVVCGLAVLAVRCRRWLDWLTLGLGAGLLLGTKHSTPLILLPVFMGVVGTLCWQAWKTQRADTAVQFGRLFAAVVLAFIVLWSLYGFRFHESRVFDAKGKYVDTFNRPLETKIEDLQSPLLRRTLVLADRGHVVPRAYLWGLADTLRAGVEGRPSLVRAWGKDYFDKAPWWIPFADLLVKVPLPFTLLAIAGCGLLLTRRLPNEIATALTGCVAIFLFFMAFIAKNGVFYAGLRHWLFDVPLMALMAAVTIVFCLEDSRRWMRWVAAGALLLIAVPTLPQRRIWEYHNVLAGGSGSAWKYFLNESVELGQRGDEDIAFWKAHVAPEQPLTGLAMREQMDANGVHPWEPRPEQVADGRLTGWFFLSAAGLPTKNWEHIEAFRDATPVARLGTTFVYHGSFYLPYGAGGILVGQGMRQIYIPSGDLAKAELYLAQGVRLNPEAATAFIELGNFAAKRGDRDGALKRYREAVIAEKDSEQVRAAIRQHITQVESSHGSTVPVMRNPFLE